ncbi:kunitz-type protease inhibitor 1-like isoform X2 [Stegastes partitus]|uniref:Kunitz-type protease inhibitor 1-like n=1 Tax=Stegastes partitus TaxID=144197 RepID=A0A3B5ACT3_9TELE|nr:PREDICTED: kunitz-type protease inhibitor 1-like isoform X2 [Stegastes partitus]
MPSSSSSSPLRPLLLPCLPLLLVLLLHLRPGGAATDCSASFRSGQGDFVLDTEDAVKEGAAPLATAHVQTAEECRSACCGDLRCNLALLEPRGSKANLTCVLFSCIHRNRFVCRFVNQEGYQSYIRETVFQKHLAGPQGQDEPSSPIAIAGRDVIVQPSVTVILNGIESQAMNDAKITKYSWSLQSGNSDVKMEKTDLPDQVKLSNLQPGLYEFQLTVTDSDGQSDDAKVKVVVLSPEMSNLFCWAPMKVGPCRAAFPRWRYNTTKGSCETFVFGGCKPNKNNYLSKEECLSACSGVTAMTERSVTALAREECGSTCRPDQLVCDNGCCLDRRLECDGVKQCSDGSDEDHCSKLNQTFNRLLDIDVNQRKALCTEPPRTGPCRASHTRWYYNPLYKKCYTFTYGGCDGNKNNFEDEQKCSEMCEGVNETHVFSRGLFERFEKEEESDSGSIALAVILSVAILALLAILTYCFLKARRKRTHRPVSTGPAHVALSEQDTLVYNSTTKPV